MPRPARTVIRDWPAGSAEADRACTPREDVVLEVQRDDGVFEQAEGPFRQYRRTVESTPDGVRETTVYELDIPLFGSLFAGPMRSAIAKRRNADDPKPWWAPPDRLSPRHAHLLGLLAAASLSATFINTIFTQTANFAATDFGMDDSGLSWGGVYVRLGVAITVPFAILADRVGRRRVVVLLAWMAPIATALGALAPTFWVLVASQAVARPLALALALLIGVVMAEEMPRNCRAYALSLLALAGGLGASVAVLALPLADLGPSGWRLVYVVALIWVFVAVRLTRGLPETARFEAPHQLNPPLRRSRFAAIAGVAILANIFVAPASFLQNNYLEDERGFNASTITLYALVTGLPGGLGLVIGGKLAESVGRKRLLLVCMPTATLFVVGAFSFSGPAMWACALAGGFLGAVAFPAFSVYRTEMFPTGNRGGVNGFITALSLAGSSVGLVLVGQLVSREWSYGSAIALVAVGQLIAAIVAYVAYPETAHLELEQLNPEDLPPTSGAPPARL